MKGNCLFIVATMIVTLVFGAGLANAEEGANNLINSKEILLAIFIILPWGHPLNTTAVIQCMRV
ncbi:MAG TPA: hypothetical protein ENI54_02530 [bacterium]|nr:hypothetical protein [bacterium]